jgi:hypothetical protein
LQIPKFFPKENNPRVFLTLGVFPLHFIIIPLEIFNSKVIKKNSFL